MRVRPYLLVLLVSVGLNALLRLRILEHYLIDRYSKNWMLDWARNGLMVLFAVLLLLFCWVLLRRLPGLLRSNSPQLHTRLRLLGVLVTALALVNLVSEGLAIYRLHLNSYSLLFESIYLYFSITLIFLFWYWYVDHPPRELTAMDPLFALGGQIDGSAYGILFPEEMMGRDGGSSVKWKPGFIDYCYFTILSSNCFGPPEGHSLVGAPIKKLHVMHSLSMISVFIIILARAINTLG
jgi:hypothetical protein